MTFARRRRLTALGFSLIGACSSAETEAPNAPVDVPSDVRADAASNVRIDALRDAASDVTRDAASDVTRDTASDATLPPTPPRPDTSSTWHIDLEAPIDTSVAADWYDVDLFDTSEAQIRALHARGSHVVCYFSAGSGENWRPDYASIPSAALGSALDGWPGERWLDVRNAGVRAVMAARLDLARRKGCDGVDPDNVDGYANANGFRLTASDQLSYNRWIASQAHSRGLVAGLKNDVEQIASLVGDFDFAVNEQCLTYSECNAVAAFTRANKSVLHIEYGAISALLRTACPPSATLRFFTILSARDRLDGDYTRCPR